MQKRRKSQRSRKLFMLIVALIIFVLIVKLFDINNDEGNIIVTIPNGSSAKEVAAILKDKDLISSQLIFRLKSRHIEPIQAGSFSIPKSSSQDEIFSIITAPSATLRFTIPEGYTIAQVDEKLAQLNLIQPGDFIECTQTCPLPENFAYTEYLTQSPRNLEGFLFPETYFLDQYNFTIGDFLNTLLEQFQSEFTPIYSDYKGKYNPYEIIIMASILEKEVRHNDDLKMVAGILWKRLENDWALGADATLLYNKNNREITASDLAADNPYNTRKFKGLPPTPITNPGARALSASANPQKSDYWFYLTDLATGNTIYSRNNAEHEANKDKYLR